jgi:hypothetical protein
MTKKDFDLIAAALKSAKPESRNAAPPRIQWALDVGRVSLALQGTNARFDPLRFRRACGEEV